MEKEKDILGLLAKDVRKLFERCNMSFDELQEIRMRIGQPLLVLYQNQEYFLLETGNLGNEPKQVHIITREEMRETMEYVSNYSMYAYENEIKQGFLTVQGGHRVGIAGKVVMEQGIVKRISQIGMLNIRLSHEKKGCSKDILPLLKGKDGFCHTLIISPPGGGKTTLLRDLIRAISSGKENVTVGVVDERSELAACYMGVPQNDIGFRSDVLDGCPKAEGMLMLVRSMAPDIVAVDEIGTIEDIHAILYAMHCGCKILATAHGNSIEEIKAKESFQELLNAYGFERFVVLKNRFQVGRVKGVYKADGSLCKYIR